MAFGWLLLLLGLFFIVPITVFHAIASSKGFYNYDLFTKKEKCMLWLSVVFFISFMIFQTDGDDVGQYSVLSTVGYRLFGRKEMYIHPRDNDILYTTIPALSAILTIVADIFLLVRLSKIKKQMKASL